MKEVYNKVILVGTVWKPEEKTFAGGTLTKFSLSVYNGKDKWTGKAKYMYVNITMFGSVDVAERQRVQVVGRLNNNTVEKDGKKITYWDVIADEITDKEWEGNKQSDNEEIPF